MKMKQHDKTYGIQLKQHLEYNLQPKMPELKESSLINNLTFYLKTLENQEQIKSQASKEEKIKIREEINEVENRKTIEKVNRNKSLFFEQISKTGKSLSRLAKKKIFKDSIRNEILESEMKQGIFLMGLQK